MQKSHRFILSAILLGAFLLSACSGALPQQIDITKNSSGSQSNTVVFTGTVQSMGGGQWLISDQQINVDDSTSVDSTIKVGDIVKVEANVSQDGIVLAIRIEASRQDSVNANDNSANTNDSMANTNDNTNTGADNSNDNFNSNDSMGNEQEVFGVVDVISSDSITVDGVTYAIVDFSEFKDVIALGDQVKLHVIFNADGTITVREIEKSTGTGIGDDNGNDNSNDNSSNYNNNGNDDHSNGNSNDDDHSNNNSNDDDHDDDNSNGSSNSNDD